MFFGQQMSADTNEVIDRVLGGDWNNLVHR